MVVRFVHARVAGVARHWMEVALKPELAAYDTPTHTSHWVLTWVHGAPRGKTPWWRRAAVATSGTSVRHGLTLWQVPDVQHRGPSRVSHADAWKSSCTAPYIVWAVASDLEARRGERPNKHAGFATLFDMQINAEVLADWGSKALPPLLAALRPTTAATAASARARPVVLYHGTGGSPASLAWLAKGEAMRGSPSGMLGAGVYCGSFWKATRFAAHHRGAATGDEYTSRKADDCVAVLRLLAFVGTEHDQVWQPYASSTAHAAAADAASWTRRARQPFVDHDCAWAKAGFLAACVRPTCVGTNPFTHKPVWVVRNEEWCVAPQRVLVRHVADLHTASVATAPWEPWRRSSAIL